MKINFYLLACFALLASCSGERNAADDDTTTSTLQPADTQLASAANAPAVNMRYCFFYTEGNKAQDTTLVSIYINGDKVTGNMNWMPKEKDARKGTLTGKLAGNAIKAIWNFNQEGAADTMAVEFQLRGNALAQKPYAYNPKTGRQQTNSKATYNVIYNMKNCK
ncbi:hypothetical protein [Mucilaginibacter ginsenosidivorax]|uniref:Copper resistance protein NlpE n=1 Tax=Mucilaginibacter ginsenosidivorax TaxID=862126 RepID=A0A5B8VX04_9SPHI|nr:hypothetical protein [Mucilaginibacter ginsenosidivorax]QEC74936.1 hypothetical protein FSB76_02865 [Mucilaginibacter ginsenosidivorax]